VVVVEINGIFVAIDHMDFREPFGVSAGRVNVETTYKTKQKKVRKARRKERFIIGYQSETQTPSKIHRRRR
jgi:hypothetical protein